MSLSEIYKACEEGDIDLVKTLIDTSSNQLEINSLESNGSSCLHIACYKNDYDIVKLLLYEYNVNPDKLNIDNQTAYEITSNHRIHQLFHQLKKDKYRFCSNENTKNPFLIIKRENNRWINHYSNDSSILTELFSDVLNRESNGYKSIFKCIGSLLFGYDSYKKKVEEWSNHIQSFIDQSLISSPTKYIYASKLLEKFKNSNNIEHLLKLYTLHKDFCQFIGNNHHNTNCFYAPIKYNLHTIEYRSFNGESYRGLTMTKEDFNEYKYAYKNKESYIQTNTFCSSSIQFEVAQLFADCDHNLENNKIKVLIKFHFDKLCSTAIILFSKFPNFQSISNFDDELEVLILPGTIFSVENIEQHNQDQYSIIHLIHYNTDEQQTEMVQDRLQSFLDSCILD